MMRDEPDAARGSEAGDFAGEGEIAGDGEIVRPDEGVVFDGQTREGGADVCGDFCGVALLGDVAEGWVGEIFGGNGRERFFDGAVPFQIAGFAAGEDDAVDAGHLAHDERQGGFDDAADTTGAEVEVEDD